MLFNTEYGEILIEEPLLEKFKKVMKHDIMQSEVENYAYFSARDHKDVSLAVGVEIEILEELTMYCK